MHIQVTSKLSLPCSAAKSELRPDEKLASTPALGLRLGLRLRLGFGLDGVRVRVWVRLGFGWGWISRMLRTRQYNGHGPRDIPNNMDVKM